MGARPPGADEDSKALSVLQRHGNARTEPALCCFGNAKAGFFPLARTATWPALQFPTVHGGGGQGRCWGLLPRPGCRAQLSASGLVLVTSSLRSSVSPSGDEKKEDQLPDDEEVTSWLGSGVGGLSSLES